MKLNIGKKKISTVDSILSTFTTGLNQLKALTVANREVSEAKRLHALVLVEEANTLDSEANRAISVVENIERLLAVPMQGQTAALPAKNTA